MKNVCLLLAALAASGCPSGPRCTQDTECAPGFVCGAEGCIPSASDGGGTANNCQGDSLGGAPNLLNNPGFECGEPPQSWFAQFGELSTETSAVRSGARAAKLTATASTTAVSLTYDGNAVAHPGNRTFCASAYLRGTAKDGRITIRRVGSNIDETFSSPLSDTDWTLVPPASYGGVKAVSQGDSALLFKVWIPNAKAGDTLIADDLQFWESSDGGCKTR